VTEIPDELHHVVIDCATGEASYTPLTPQELADLEQRNQDHVAQVAAEKAEADGLKAAAEAHPDPLVQALARKAGIL
jgi:hypothetical protein